MLSSVLLRCDNVSYEGFRTHAISFNCIDLLSGPVELLISIVLKFSSYAADPDINYCYGMHVYSFGD